VPEPLVLSTRLHAMPHCSRRRKSSELLMLATQVAWASSIAKLYDQPGEGMYTKAADRRCRERFSASELISGRKARATIIRRASVASDVCLSGRVFLTLLSLQTATHAGAA